MNEERQHTAQKTDSETGIFLKKEKFWNVKLFCSIYKVT